MYRAAAINKSSCTFSSCFSRSVCSSAYTNSCQKCSLCGRCLLVGLNMKILNSGSITFMGSIKSKATFFLKWTFYRFLNLLLLIVTLPPYQCTTQHSLHHRRCTCTTVAPLLNPTLESSLKRFRCALTFMLPTASLLFDFKDLHQLIKKKSSAHICITFSTALMYQLLQSTQNGPNYKQQSLSSASVGRNTLQKSDFIRRKTDKKTTVSQITLGTTVMSRKASRKARQKPNI